MTATADKANATGRLHAVVICAHLRRDRSERACHDFLQPMNGLQIASQLDPAQFSVTLHHEDWHGPYRTGDIPATDIVFLSGLQADFDRMRQLSYFFRRQGTMVVAGGSICTQFPEFASRFFDVVCAGGIDLVGDVVADFLAGDLKPIYRRAQSSGHPVAVDYRHWQRHGVTPRVHFVEASRGCSFRCDFCVVPAERARHMPYSLATVKQAIDDSLAASPRFSIRRRYPMVWFVDNNFSDNIPFMREICALLKADRRIRFWGALVTQNILRDRALVDYLADSGCRVLFSGLESVDIAFLKSHNKKQNLSRHGSVVDDILYAESRGICVTYAYLFDPRIMTVADMQQQIDTLVNTRGLPMPAFFSVVSPLLGTGCFWACARAGELRKNLRLRDLDGEVIAYRTLADDESAVAHYARLLSASPGKVIHLPRLLLSTLVRIWNSHSLNFFYWWVLLASNFRPFLFSSHYRQRPDRTYLGGSDALDPQYHQYPDDISPRDKARYFAAVEITDADGELVPWLHRYQPAPQRREATAADQHDTEQCA